jgi:hypothetical protein
MGRNADAIIPAAHGSGQGQTRRHRQPAKLEGRSEAESSWLSKTEGANGVKAWEERAALSAKGAPGVLIDNSK